MTQKGIGHDVIPARSRLPHRHGSFHSVPVGGHFLGDELCSPISMQHAPCGEAATGGAAMSSAVNQVGALLLTHDVSLDSTRVRITHDAQVDPAVGAAQVGSSPVEWCNRFVSFGLGYALSWSGVSSCPVGCGVSRDLVRMSRLR